MCLYRPGQFSLEANKAHAWPGCKANFADKYIAHFYKEPLCGIILLISINAQ